MSPSDGARGLAVSLAALAAFTWAIAGCAAPSGKVLKMVNDTRVTVTMRTCSASSRAPRCSAASRVRPGSSASFPLPHYVRGSAARQVVITGYGKARCFTLPSSHLPGDALASVTDARPPECVGPYELLPAA